MRMRRNKKKSIKQQFLEGFEKFNRISKEVKERERTPVEKIVWLLIFLICFSYCGCLIWKSYWKWMKSPSIVLLTENSESILKIPFPAVTVCPERKIRTSVFSFEEYNFNISEYSYENLTEKEQQMYEDMLMICDWSHTEIKGRKFSKANETVSNIRKVSPKLSNVIQLCKWNGKLRSCSNMFTTIFTETGLCYTFNTIGPVDMFRIDKLNSDYEYMPNLTRTRIKNWTPQNSYLLNAPMDHTYPERGSGAGAKAGLKLILSEDIKGMDPDCKGMISGFKILLHHPTELPRLTQQYIRIPIYEEVTIAFKPKKIVTSNGLRMFPSERRQCYYTGEHNLKYFKLYTQTNCEFECLSNFTYARCDCVHYSMPQPTVNEKIEQKTKKTPMKKLFKIQ
ncbi:pickpocket protein 28-like [Pararge aegeria]|uniref:pickpocket protein 28-like n=1 Tax=Pararge aegeria TaxID=116150 RepID=UPI0019CFAABA|nr:pickpocket protein 28-like [Pararge aegeria]